MIPMSFNRLFLLRFHYYLLQWTIHRIYYATLKMFKIFDSTAVHSSDDEDEMGYLCISQFQA